MSRHKHHRKNKKRLLRNIVSTILSFVLAMFLGVLLCIISLQFGFFDSDLILSKINESNYYNEVYSELTSNIQTILASKELPEDLVADCITDKRVYINGKQYIDNSLKGNDTIVTVDNINDELYTILENYYTSSGIKIDEVVQSNIESIINDIDSEYIRMIRFQFVDYVKNYKNAYKELLIWFVPTVILLSVIIIGILLKIHKYPHRGVRFTMISLASASIMNLLLPLYCIINKTYNNLNILPDYYGSFLETYTKWSCYAFIYVGAFGFVLSLLLFGGVRILKQNIK